MFGRSKTDMRTVPDDGDAGADFSAEGIEVGQGEEQKMKWRETWEDSTGMLLILCSELFGTGMAAAARSLEMGDRGMMTLQITFVRFGITLALSCLYCWYTKMPDFPFGKPEIRWLLVLRGIGGAVGVSGFYYSLEYLSVAEAVLIGFTCPILTAYACSIFLRAPFDKKQLAAGVISFLGIVLIAQPGPLSKLPGSHTNTDMPGEVTATPAQRLSAVLVGLAGALGRTCAYTTIRVIGTRVHPFISVNYYALIATCSSGLVLLLPIFPDVSFRLPHGFREWGLLIGLCIFGFFLQFLMISGLVKDKSSRATNMMYSSVVFGLLADFVIWGVVPSWLSWVGGAIVTAATVWGSMQKADTGPQKAEAGRDEEYAVVPGDEMLVSDDDGNEEDDEHGNEVQTELQNDTI